MHTEQEIVEFVELNCRIDDLRLMLSALNSNQFLKLATSALTSEDSSTSAAEAFILGSLALETLSMWLSRCGLRFERSDGWMGVVVVVVCVFGSGGF